MGATAVELGDIVLVPKYGHIPGVLLLALAAESRLDGNRLSTPGSWPTFIAIFLFFLTLLLRAKPFSVWSLMAVGFSGIVLVETVAYVAQANFNLLVPTAGAHFVNLGVVLALVLNELSNRRAAIESISRDNARMQAILDRVVEDNFDGVIIIDSQERILTASKPAESILQARHGLLAKKAQNLPCVFYKEASRILRSRMVEGVPAKSSNIHYFDEGVNADKGFPGPAVALEYSITVSKLMVLTVLLSAWLVLPFAM